MAQRARNPLVAGAVVSGFSTALTRPGSAARVTAGDAQLLLTVRGRKLVAKLVDAPADTVAQVEQLLGEGLSAGSPPDLVSPEEAAAMLGVSRPTVVRWAAEGQLTDYRVGSHHRYDRSEVQELRERRARQAAANRQAAVSAWTATVAGGLEVEPSPAELIAAGQALRAGDREGALAVLARSRRADARRAAAAAGAAVPQ